MLTIAVKQPSSQLPRLRISRNKDKRISRLGLRRLMIKKRELLSYRRRQTKPLIGKSKKQQKLQRQNKMQLQHLFPGPWTNRNRWRRPCESSQESLQQRKDGRRSPLRLTESPQSCATRGSGSLSHWQRQDSEEIYIIIHHKLYDKLKECY